MKASISSPPPLFVNWKFRFIVPANVMQNGRDALVASAYGTWNTGDIPFSAARRGRRGYFARRCRSMGHGRDKRDHPARPSRRRQREGRACRVRLRNVEHRGHPIQRHARRCRSMGHGRDKRDPPARPSRRRQTGGTRLSRPPTERGTQGTFHPAPRAEGGAGTSRADAVRWARSRQARPSRATIPEKTTRGTRLSRPPTERGVRPRNPPGETSRDPPRAKNKARREHASGRTELAEGGGFEPPIR